MRTPIGASGIDRKCLSDSIRDLVTEHFPMVRGKRDVQENIIFSISQHSWVLVVESNLVIDLVIFRVEKILNLLSETNKISLSQLFLIYLDVGTPDALCTLCHSSWLTLPSFFLSARSKYRRI